MPTKDPLFNFKYMGYCKTDYPTPQRTFEDLVRIAKFYLCRKTHTLEKDPIWEKYRDEELIIEYFGWAFSDNQKFKEDFESEINKEDTEKESIIKWLEEQSEAEDIEVTKEVESLEDVVSFNPNDLGAK